MNMLGHQNVRLLGKCIKYVFNHVLQFLHYSPSKLYNINHWKQISYISFNKN